MSVVCSVLSLFEAFQRFELSVVLPIGDVSLHMAQLLLLSSRNYRRDVRQRSKHSFLANWHVFVVKARPMAEDRFLIQVCLAIVLLRHEVGFHRRDML
jgi:hypothetical protein